jgi:hypothetical protein
MNPTTMTRLSNGVPVATSAEYSSYVIVHRDHAGFVIGAGGVTVKDIAVKTNTWIRIQPVNEFSFGHPWFLIKGRTEDVVAKAHHYITSMSFEAERRHPRWSIAEVVEPHQVELTADDISNIDDYYNTLNPDMVSIGMKNTLASIEDTHEFNAILTDFECKDLDARIDAETAEFYRNNEVGLDDGDDSSGDDDESVGLEYDVSAPLMADRSQTLIVSPINKNRYSNSNVDYREQLVRFRNGDQLMWDDSKHNVTKEVGGLFCFVHNDCKVEICRVMSVHSPKHRLESWASNVGQGDRNVLCMSNIMVTLSWVEWIAAGGHKKVQGTTQVVTNKNRIIDLIESKM